VLNQHALDFSDHAHRLLMRCRAGQPVFKIFQSFLGNSDLLAVKALFLELVEASNYLGLLLGGHGLDLFDDLCGVHIS